MLRLDLRLKLWFCRPSLILRMRVLVCFEIRTVFDLVFSCGLRLLVLIRIFRCILDCLSNNVIGSFCSSLGIGSLFLMMSLIRRFSVFDPTTLSDSLSLHRLWQLFVSSVARTRTWSILLSTHAHPHSQPSLPSHRPPPFLLSSNPNYTPTTGILVPIPCIRIIFVSALA